MSQEFSGAIEFAPFFKPRAGITHVMFDFDGTLSLVRAGWTDLMVRMFEELLPPRPGDAPEEIRRMLYEDISALNGKPTIHQMEKFTERVRERGVEPESPEAYKKEYTRRLTEMTSGRIASLKNRNMPADAFMVFSSIALLDELRKRGLQLFLASGTDEPSVKAEAELLGIKQYFGDHLYGARDQVKLSPKRMVVERLMKDGVRGDAIMAIGDGPEEINIAKEIGAFSIGVASDEAEQGAGKMDDLKRKRLLEAGAHVVIPDYRDAGALLRKIFEK